MLVLTRKTDEKIIINNNIEIVVVEAGNGQVSLGIDAPDNISIYREEIYSKIEAENKKAIKNKDIDIDKLLKIKQGNKEKKEKTSYKKEESR